MTRLVPPAAPPAGSPDALNVPGNVFTSNYPKVTLTPAQLASIAYWAGFRGNNLVQAVATALAESSGYTYAHNSYQDPTTGITYDVWGILQISTIHNIGPAQSTNPYFAMWWAYRNTGPNHDFWHQPGAPWAGDNWQAFVGTATDAASQVTAQMGGAGPTGSNPFNPSQTLGGQIQYSGYGYTGTPTTYRPYQPVWNVDDITMAGVYDPSSGTSSSGKLSDFKLGAASLRDLLLSCEVELTTTQGSQLTLTFERGDELAADGRLFPAGTQNGYTGTVITVRGLKFAVSGVEVEADPAGTPQLVVTALALPVMKLMNLVDQSKVDPAQVAPDGSATLYLGEMCAAQQIVFYGQDTAVGSGSWGDYLPLGDPLSGLPPDSAWTYVQKLTQAFGFWAFEAGGALWFGQPSALVGWGNTLVVNYVPAGQAPDDTAPVGTPKLSANVTEVPQGYAKTSIRQTTRTVEVELPQWYACQAKCGDQLVLNGFSGNFDSVPTTPGTHPAWNHPQAAYIITRMSWSVDGGLSNVSVSAQEAIDPYPQYPATATFGVAQNTAAVAGVDTPGDGTAATFLAEASKQVGVPYVYGGASPGTGFDCSGLVQWAAQQAGVVVPRTSEQQWQAIVAAGQQIPVSVALDTPGALLFPSNDPTPDRPGHVAISVGDGSTILQAPKTGMTVNESPYSQNQWLTQAGLIPGMTYSGTNGGGQYTRSQLPGYIGPLPTSPDAIP